MREVRELESRLCSYVDEEKVWHRAIKIIVA